jgi:glycosyltransferase involved in cell wall biosynthesis
LQISDSGDRSLARAELWILGEGPERAALEALAGELDISERVHMPGHVPREEAFRMLCASHALVHPSLHESGGGVCLEAMAAGRPVLGFDLGGTAVHVGPDAGVLIHAAAPTQAVAGLANAMASVAAHPAKYRAMGQAGRALVRRSFAWEDRVAEMAGRYRGLVAGAPGGDSLPRTRSGGAVTRAPILERIDG